MRYSKSAATTEFQQFSPIFGKQFLAFTKSDKIFAVRVNQIKIS